MRAIPMFGRFGTELRDLDITRPLSETEIAAVRRAYADTNLIMVRGQRLSFDEYTRFVRYLWPFKTDESGAPAWSSVSNVDVRGRTGTGVLLYHQDDAFLPAPCRALSLYANQASDTSAPTSFVSALHAARELEPDLRDRLEPLHACHLIDVHCTDGDSTYRVRECDLPADAPRDRYPRTSHPVLFPLSGDPSGEKVLYVSEYQTSHIVDMPIDESEALLQSLFARLYAADNTFLHHWEPHDVLVWNNIALQHGRPTVVGDGPRDFWRLKTFDVPAASVG